MLLQSAGLFATMSFIVEIKTMQNGVRALNTSEKWPKYSPTNKKQSAVDIVINKIVDDVLTGHYKPGDKLPTEMQLAEMMSMSKNTVREAIKILVAYGAVEIRRPEGTFITHSFTPKMLNPVIYSLLFSKSNADDLLGLRRMIDTGVFLLIIDCGLDKEDEAALEAQHMVIKEYQNNVLTQGMQWPEWLFGIWLPIGLAVLCIRFIQWGVYLVQGRDFKDTSKEGNNG